MSLANYQGTDLETLLAYKQEDSLENLAVAVKCIIDCGRPQFVVEDLRERSGPELSSDFFTSTLRTLVEKDYLREEKSSMARYFIKSPGKLRLFYEKIKKKVPSEFIELVLEERSIF